MSKLIVAVLTMIVALAAFTPSVRAASEPSFLFSIPLGQPALTGAVGVEVDSVGNIYVAVQGVSQIVKLGPTGTEIWHIGSPGSGDGQFKFPRGVAVDGAGNVYVADGDNVGDVARIQKFDTSGNFLLKFGAPGSGDGQFKFPLGVEVDGSGNIYIADAGNDRIQKFDPSGNFVLKFGSHGSSDGQFFFPTDVALDDSGNIYVADFGDDSIKKFDSSGNFLLKFGTFGSGNGQFDGPQGVAVDSAGNVYVADRGNTRIQKFDPRGNFLLKFGSDGSGDGQFRRPLAVAVDSAGNVYVADRDNHRIQKFDSSGNFLLKLGTFGSSDGEFSSPNGVAVDSSGNIYVIDGGNPRIQKFDSSGNFLLKFGSPGSGDGEFSSPTDVAVDSSGNIYAVDSGNSRIQKFDTDGNFLLKWGSRCSLKFGHGNCVDPDGSGPLELGDGQFEFPAGIAVDSSNNVYVADSGNSRIQKFDTDGNLLLKWGSRCSLKSGFGNCVDPDGSGPLELGDGQFESPGGIAVDSSSNVYAADTGNHRVQKFDSSGNFLLKFGTFGSGDGQFEFPAGIAVDSSSNVYAADTGNDRVQKFDSSGNFLLKFGTFGSGDGEFFKPGKVAVDSSGNIYVIDGGNHRIQVFGAPIPPDSDGDGIPDSVDACPGTAPGATVDENGCPPEQATENLIDQVEALVTAGTLDQDHADKLLEPLEKAVEELNQGEVDEAIGEFQEFIDEVNELIGERDLSSTDGQPLIDAANDIFAAIEATGFDVKVSIGLVLPDEDEPLPPESVQDLSPDLFTSLVESESALVRTENVIDLFTASGSYIPLLAQPKGLIPSDITFDWSEATEHIDTNGKSFASAILSDEELHIEVEAAEISKDILVHPVTADPLLSVPGLSEQEVTFRVKGFTFQEGDMFGFPTMDETDGGIIVQNIQVDGDKISGTISTAADSALGARSVVFSLPDPENPGQRKDVVVANVFTVYRGVIPSLFELLDRPAPSQRQAFPGEQGGNPRTQDQHTQLLNVINATTLDDAREAWNNFTRDYASLTAPATRITASQVRVLIDAAAKIEGNSSKTAPFPAPDIPEKLLTLELIFLAQIESDNTPLALAAIVDETSYGITQFTNGTIEFVGGTSVGFVKDILRSVTNETELREAIQQISSDTRSDPFQLLGLTIRNFQNLYHSATGPTYEEDDDFNPSMSEEFFEFLAVGHRQRADAFPPDGGLDFSTTPDSWDPDRIADPAGRERAELAEEFFRENR